MKGNVKVIWYKNNHQHRSFGVIYIIHFILLPKSIKDITGHRNIKIITLSISVLSLEHSAYNMFLV
jgi:hypothetical protein